MKKLALVVILLLSGCAKKPQFVTVFPGYLAPAQKVPTQAATPTIPDYATSPHARPHSGAMSPDLVAAANLKLSGPAGSAPRAQMAATLTPRIPAPLPLDPAGHIIWAGVCAKNQIFRGSWNYDYPHALQHPGWSWGATFSFTDDRLTHTYRALCE